LEATECEGRRKTSNHQGVPRDPVGETGGTRSAAASAGLLDLHGRLGIPPRGMNGWVIYDI